MSRRPRLILRLLLGVLLLSAAGFYLWAFQADRGTEICVRCGSLRAVVRMNEFPCFTLPGATGAHPWVREHIGTCPEHAWHRIGCWQRGAVISCTIVPKGHSLHEALARLNDLPARELAKRFSVLPEDQKWELLRMANRLRAPDLVPGHEAEVAHAVAEQAGWDDLAAAWPL